MRKGIDGFENVTAINTRSMRERVFVFERPDAEVAAEAIELWNGDPSPDIAYQIRADTHPTQSSRKEERLRDELRIKLHSIIVREESLTAEDDEALSMLWQIIDRLPERTIEHDALYRVIMLYRASLRGETAAAIDPLIVAEQILRQNDEEAESVTRR